MRAEVKEFPWQNMEICINGGVELWRICFTSAIGANLSGRSDLKEAYFEH